MVIDRRTGRREVAEGQTTLVHEHVQSRRAEPVGSDRPRSARRTR
ncbi:hypothetical protein [Streptomyces sp. Root1310]|nr:hypothetical protein [Streptomyces sp. Root1310]